MRTVRTMRTMCVAPLSGEDGPVVVVREYAEAEVPTLLMGRERFVSVDDRCSSDCSSELAELTIDESAAAAPVAQACSGSPSPGLGPIPIPSPSPSPSPSPGSPGVQR